VGVILLWVGVFPRESQNPILVALYTACCTATHCTLLYRLVLPLPPPPGARGSPGTSDCVRARAAMVGAVDIVKGLAAIAHEQDDGLVITTQNQADETTAQASSSASASPSPRAQNSTNIDRESGRGARSNSRMSRSHPRWIPDSDVDSCMLCGAAFTTFTRRRHHCRSCGWVVCITCMTAGAPFLSRSAFATTIHREPIDSEGPCCCCVRTEHACMN
jgi:hypothetical protein